MVTKDRAHLHNPQLKDAGLFKFVKRFGTICHESANKIHVHGYLSALQETNSLLTYFTYSLTFSFHYMTCKITITGFSYYD